MRRLARALPAGLAAVLAPASVFACATCVSSAFGDRTYNWAYLGLLVMPFLITAVVGAIVAWSAGVRPRRPAWLPASLLSGRAGAPPPPAHHGPR